MVQLSAYMKVLFLLVHELYFLEKSLWWTPFLYDFDTVQVLYNAVKYYVILDIDGLVLMHWRYCSLALSHRYGTTATKVIKDLTFDSQKTPSISPSIIGISKFVIILEKIDCVIMVPYSYWYMYMYQFVVAHAISIPKYFLHVLSSEAYLISPWTKWLPFCQTTFSNTFSWLKV